MLWKLATVALLLHVATCKDEEWKWKSNRRDGKARIEVKDSPSKKPLADEISDLNFDSDLTKRVGPKYQVNEQQDAYNPDPYDRLPNRGFGNGYDGNKGYNGGSGGYGGIINGGYSGGANPGFGGGVNLGYGGNGNHFYGGGKNPGFVLSPGYAGGINPGFGGNINPGFGGGFGPGYGNQFGPGFNGILVGPGGPNGRPFRRPTFTSRPGYNDQNAILTGPNGPSGIIGPGPVRGGHHHSNGVLVGPDGPYDNYGYGAFPYNNRNANGAYGDDAFQGRSADTTKKPKTA